MGRREGGIYLKRSFYEILTDLVEVQERLETRPVEKQTYTLSNQKINIILSDENIL